MNEIFYSDTASRDYRKFPYDEVKFDYDFQLESIKYNGEIIRFDYYRTTKHEIIWNPRIDNLPELDVCFDKTKIETIIDNNRDL